SNTCSGVLAPSATCKATVAFAPSLPGLRTGSITMLPPVALARGSKVTASGGALASASLKGTGTQQALLDMPSTVDFGSLHTGTPGCIGFGDPMRGTQSAAQRIQIRNEGGAPAPVDLTTRSTDFLIVGGSCGATIAPQGTCFADIVFQPGGFGGRVGQFRVNS